MNIIVENKSTYSFNDGKFINNTQDKKVQDEILAEIHDTICQELFNIVCSLHNLSNSLSSMTEEEAINSLNLVSECSRDTLSKLRGILYKPILASLERRFYGVQEII